MQVEHRAALGIPGGVRKHVGPTGAGDELRGHRGATAGAEPGDDAADAVLDRVHAQVDTVGDLLVGVAVGDQGDDLEVVARGGGIATLVLVHVHDAEDVLVGGDEVDHLLLHRLRLRRAQQGLHDVLLQRLQPRLVDVLEQRDHVAVALLEHRALREVHPVHLEIREAAGGAAIFGKIHHDDAPPQTDR